MSKKFVFFLMFFSVFFLVGCNQEEQISNSGTGNSQQEDMYIPDEVYVVSGNGNGSLSLNGNIMLENIKTIVSNNGGILKQLNCQEGTNVYPSYTIAEVVPDYSSPSIQNLQIQKRSLQSQIENTNSIIQSTKSSYKQQIENMENQIENSKMQISTLKDNVKILEAQKGSTSGDISTQIKNLKDQISSIKENIRITKSSKEQDINKIKDNIANIEDNIANIKNDVSVNIRTVLDEVDKVFGVTDKNETKNDAYEQYLSAKNSSLKNKVENKFKNLNKTKTQIVNMPNEEFSSYLEDVVDLTEMAANAVDASVSTSEFPQTSQDPTQPTIDGLYNKFIQYVGSLTKSKTNFENTYSNLKTTKNSSLEVTKNNYETKINDLQTQLESSKENLENLKNNKLSSSLGNLDSQINSLKNQILSLQNSIDNTRSQIKTTKEQRDIKLQELNNQKINQRQKIDSIQTQLAPEIIKAEVNGTIDKKIKSQGDTVKKNKALCEIIPDSKNNFKVRFFSPQKLQIGTPVTIRLDEGESVKKEIERELPSKDSVTQNYVYEVSFNSEQISELKNEDDVKVNVNKTSVISSNQGEKKTIIPLNYIIPQLNGDYVYEVKNPSEVLQDSKDYKNLDIQKTKVKLGEINGGYVRVLTGLQVGNVIAK